MARCAQLLLCSATTPQVGCPAGWLPPVALQFNFGHAYGQAASWMANLLKVKEPALRSWAQVVIATPAGLGAPRYIKPLFQPLSHYEVMTLAK
jgi:hypothetical protein